MPKIIIASIILILCVIGSYALGNNMFDLWVMLIAGIIGYFMSKHDFPAFPVILALILGPMMESNLRRSLLIAEGDWTSLVLMGMWLYPYIYRSINKTLPALFFNNGWYHFNK